jgi:hypothetical protein
MQFERHRPPRNPVAIGIELTDMQSEKHISAHTKDLTLFGCFVETATPFPQDTKVRLKMLRGGKQLFAHGRVTYSQPGAGMGIAFVTIEPSSLPVLDAWLANLREE